MPEIIKDRDHINVLKRENYHRNRDRYKAQLREQYKRRVERYSPEERKEIKRKSRYNLSPDQYLTMVEEQGGKCAICFRMRKLSVDHNHECCENNDVKTCGKCTRGLLCAHCNHGLGHFEDSTEFLAAAIEYVAKYKQQETQQMEIHDNFFSQGNAHTDFQEADESPAFAPFEPINDLVLVKLWQEDNSKIGSIVVAEKYRQRSNRAIIVAVGDKVTARVQAGDRILLGIGNVEDVNVNGENLLLIREGDIRGFERKL